MQKLMSKFVRNRPRPGRRDNLGQRPHMTTTRGKEGGNRGALASISKSRGIRRLEKTDCRKTAQKRVLDTVT